MNFRKSIAAIAAASITAVSMSAAAGAELTLDGAKTDANGMDLVCASSSSWMPIAYNNGERNESVLADKNKAIVDYGVDWSAAKSVEIQWHVVEGTEEDWAEENCMGGAVIVSSNAAGDSSHNWPAKEFYGVNDDALEFTAAEEKELKAEKVSDYTYKVVCPIDDTNSVVANPQLVQISFSDYAKAVWWQCAVEYMAVKDASGNTLVSWEGAAPRSDYTGAAAPTAAAPAAAEEPAETTEAPVVTTGNVDAATDSSKGSPDTGIEDVAAVAGLAVLAAGAFVVAKKRK
jgi:hypothetical protein